MFHIGGDRGEFRALTKPSAMVVVENGRIGWLSKGKIIATMREDEIEKYMESLRLRREITFSEMTKLVGNSVRASLLMNWLAIKGVGELKSQSGLYDDAIDKRELELVFKPVNG